MEPTSLSGEGDSNPERMCEQAWNESLPGQGRDTVEAIPMILGACRKESLGIRLYGCDGRAADANDIEDIGCRPRAVPWSTSDRKSHGYARSWSSNSGERYPLHAMSDARRADSVDTPNFARAWLVPTTRKERLARWKPWKGYILLGCTLSSVHATGNGVCIVWRMRGTSRGS